MSLIRLFPGIVLSILFASQLSAQNLINNGGFENGNAGWTLMVQSGFSATAAYPTEGAPEGTTFARVTVTQVNVTDPNSDNWKVQLQAPEWTAERDAIYRLVFKVRSTVPTLKVGINRGGSGDYVNGFDIALDTLWQTRSCMFTSDTAGAGKLRINFYIGADTGVYEFDSFSLVRTGTVIPDNSLITNGGFELEGSGWNLFVQTSDGAEATASYPDDSAAEGTKYARVTVVSASDMSQVQLQLPLFAADSGETYVVTYKAKGTGSIRVVSQYDANRSYQTKESFTQDLTTEWATYSQSFSADTSGQGTLRLNFHLGVFGGGTFDFDSVSVTKAPVSVRRDANRRVAAVRPFSVHTCIDRMIVFLPPRTGEFSIGLYTPAGRLLRQVHCAADGITEMVIPRNEAKGMFLVRYADRDGTITRKVQWFR